MSKKEVFTITRQSELSVDFSRIPREQIGDYDKFLHSKVEAGRASMQAGVGRSNEEVEAQFAARRSKVGRGM